eukprot:4455970-Prymnesium_polylepis.2
MERERNSGCKGRQGVGGVKVSGRSTACKGVRELAEGTAEMRGAVAGLLMAAGWNAGVRPGAHPPRPAARSRGRPQCARQTSGTPCGTC